MDLYIKSFNIPKLTFDEIDNHIESNGLKILIANEKRRFKWKLVETMSVIFSQAKLNYPKIKMRDLLSNNVLRIIQK